MKHIGIVVCSAEGAALCFREICGKGPERMGKHMHPEISMHAYPLGEYMVHIRAGDWESIAELMLATARKLASIGADFLICPDNTIHQAFELVAAKSPVPWLHIAETVAMEAKKRGFANLGVLGTKYLMTGPVYPQTLKRFGMTCQIPEESDREGIDEIIFDELVNGVFTDESRLYFNEVIGKLKDKGCDAVVLGCTEIPLLVVPGESPLPTLDSTRLLAKAALEKAVEET